MGAKSRAVKRLKKDRSVSSTVHVLAVTDLDHRHRLGCVIDRVEDAVVPLPDPILLLPGQLLHALGSRRHGKYRDLGGDQAANFRWEALEFLGGGTFDDDVIASRRSMGVVAMRASWPASPLSAYAERGTGGEAPDAPPHARADGVTTLRPHPFDPLSQSGEGKLGPSVVPPLPKGEGDGG